MKNITRTLTVVFLVMNLILLNYDINLYGAEEQQRGHTVKSSITDEDGQIIGQRWDCVQAEENLDCAPIGSYLEIYG